MQTFPLADVPSQILSVSAGSQSCRLRIFTRRADLYLDLYVADTLVLSGAPCRDGVPIVRDAYLGFIGDLMFVDTQGSSDPSTSGLGSRFSLVYCEAADLAAAV